MLVADCFFQDDLAYIKIGSLKYQNIHVFMINEDFKFAPYGNSNLHTTSLKGLLSGYSHLFQPMYFPIKYFHSLFFRCTG